MTLSRTAALFLALLLCSCGADRGGRAPTGATDELWRHFEVEGEWAEFFATLAELTHSADLVFTGDVERAQVAPVFQGDAAEDRVYEALLSIRVREALRGDPGTVVTLPLLVVDVHNDGDYRVAVAEMNAQLPSGPLLFFLRKRRDRDALRVVNGYGIWAATRRSPVDAPLNPSPPSDGTYAEEVERFDSFGELVDAIRGAASQPPP